MNLRIIFLFVFLQGTFLIHAQETIGLLYHNVGVYDGYTLFTPENNNSVFLIDNCGNSINEWTFTERPALTCYLLENGMLLRAGRDKLEIRDWDNSLIWSYDISALGFNQHHDIEPLPNGNILCLVKDILTLGEQIALGKNPALVNSNLGSEKIVEFQPIGNDQITVVWEWRFKDHLIQDFDASKSTYGVVTDHPELVDFNYEDYNMTHSDWLHMNSVEYNADLDQILMSSKSLGEIYIIDHSTTTVEAASHLGGNYNKGGDFLWRWGNPEVYRQGTPSDRKLFEQHDAKWVSNGYLHEGKISVFNNEVAANETSSSINLLTPEPITSGYAVSNGTFLPADFYYSWEGEVLGETVFEGKKSGAISLPNGNFLFCETSKGRLTELNNDGEIVWIYVNPSGTDIFNQFDTSNEINEDNSIFRGEKYPIDYPGFNGRDLTPSSIIEDVNANSDVCNQTLAVNDTMLDTPFGIVSNPIVGGIVEFTDNLQKSDIEVYSVSGTIIKSIKSFNGHTLDMNFLASGLYFIRLNSNSQRQILKIIKL